MHDVLYEMICIVTLQGVLLENRQVTSGCKVEHMSN